MISPALLAACGIAEHAVFHYKKFPSYAAVFDGSARFVVNRPTSCDAGYKYLIGSADSTHSLTLVFLPLDSVAFVARRRHAP
jgi:hypothetical protein